MNKTLRELIARFPHVNPLARQCTDAELEAYMVQGIAAQDAEVEKLKQDCRNYLHEVEQLKARIVRLECEAKAHDVASVPDGFVMVPAEPTDAMKLAGNDALAQHWGAGDAIISKMARILSDRAASACCVDPDDYWKLYGQDCIDDVRAMLEGAKHE